MVEFLLIISIVSDIARPDPLTFSYAAAPAHYRGTGEESADQVPTVPITLEVWDATEGHPVPTFAAWNIFYRFNREHEKLWR